MISSIRGSASLDIALTLALIVSQGIANAQAPLPAAIADDFTLLMEPLSAEWESRLLPPLLQGLMRIAPYSTVHAPAPDALRAVADGTRRLALLRRSSALTVGDARAIEWMEIGPASCLMLVVRDDAAWSSYGDLNYGLNRALRVDATSEGALRNFERVLSEFPLAGERQIQVRPALIAIQRLAAWDTDLVALDVPRRDAGNLPPEVMPLVNERGLRLLAMPPALFANSRNLIEGEVLVSNGWFWESPQTYQTLCDPFVLAMPTANADRLVHALQIALAIGQAEPKQLAAAPGMSFALRDEWAALTAPIPMNPVAAITAPVAPPTPEPPPSAPAALSSASGEGDKMTLETVAPIIAETPVCDPAVPYVFRHVESATSLTLTRCALDQGKPRLLVDPPLTNPLVLMLQRHLNDLGFKAGRPDGMIGRRTREAVRQFQTARGMTANGSIDFDLLERIQQANASR
jgi:hypothetical protein